MNIDTLYPPSNIGIIGGGQLGRMISVCAKQLGYNVIVLDPTVGCPASQVADECIVAAFSDANALEKLASRCKVITYEFEHIDADLIIALEQKGHKIIPSGRTLKIIQNKFHQKLLLKSMELPTPQFYSVNSEEEILNLIKEIGLPIVLKSTIGGYDGKGNFVIKDASQVSKAFNDLGGKNLMVEEFVNFNKELSIVVSRDKKGSAFFPIVENIHEDSILRITKAPADINESLVKEITSIADSIVRGFNDIGIFCIELFLTCDGKVYINEIAPRPHNSAHYTIEGCKISQFEQLVRILVGLPMGSSELKQPSVMVNLLGANDVVGNYKVEGLCDVVAEYGIYFHLYGKEYTKPLKKLGHITVCDNNIENAEKKAIKALKAIRIKSL